MEGGCLVCTRLLSPHHYLLRRVVLTSLVLVIALAVGIMVFFARQAAAPWTGPVSDHFDGHRFTNIGNVPEKTGRDVLKWQLTSHKRPWLRWIDEAPGPKPIERVNDGSIRVTWINHATVLVQMDNVNILTDPIYSKFASPVSWAGPARHRNPGIRWEDLPPIDLVVVSHNHYDHMDMPTLRRLSQRPEAPRIVVGLGNTAYLSARRVARSEDIDWWQAVQVQGVKATAVPVQHWSSRAQSDNRRTLWAGFVFEGPSGRVYFGGDTGYGPHFSLVRERLGSPDVALLPIGAYLPIWFMKENHMTPAEGVQASVDLGARSSVPIHFGTWQLGDDGDKEPLQDLEAALATNPTQRAVWRVVQHGVAERYGRLP